MYSTSHFKYDVNRLSDAIKSKTLDRLTLKRKDKKSKFTKQEISGSIRMYENDRVLIRLDPDFQFDRILECDKFDIFFVINPIPYRAQHTALQFFKSHSLFDLLIKNPIYNSYNEMDNQMKIENKYENFDLNDEQRSAVEHIVNKRDNLPPYILYGPAGTGKTKTLVAAIAHIVQTTTDNVLVCTQTNLACDEITERLMKYLKKDEMLRLYAKSYPVQDVNDKLRAYSNICKVDSHFYFDYPRLACIYSYRVVICTLCTSSCLARAIKDKKVWKPNHFQYVFNDENACTTELLSLVSIAGEHT